MTNSKKSAPPVHDHIGLYPAARPPAPTKTGGGDADNIRPLVYQLTIAEGVGELHADLNHPLAAPVKRSASSGKPCAALGTTCVCDTPMEVRLLLLGR